MWLPVSTVNDRRQYAPHHCMTFSRGNNSSAVRAWAWNVDTQSWISVLCDGHVVSWSPLFPAKECTEYKLLLTEKLVNALVIMLEVLLPFMAGVTTACCVLLWKLVWKCSLHVLKSAVVSFVVYFFSDWLSEWDTSDNKTQHSQKTTAEKLEVN